MLYVRLRLRRCLHRDELRDEHGVVVEDRGVAGGDSGTAANTGARARRDGSSSRRNSAKVGCLGSAGPAKARDLTGGLGAPPAAVEVGELKEAVRGSDESSEEEKTSESSQEENSEED